MEAPPKPKTVLITGATGSFGSALMRYLLADPDGPRVRAYSRDEDKQERLSRELPPNARTTYILGDVRDFERLSTAAHGCDYIVHAAALKRVPQGETNSDEFLDVNTIGTANVIQAAQANGILRTLLVSSDKAVEPINHYGRTKATAEGLITQANMSGVSRGCMFATARGGNVWASRGSVVEKWREAQRREEPLAVTGEQYTRFHLQMSDWVAFVWRAVNAMHGGEIFLPKCRAWRLIDLARATQAAYNIVPQREGDKDHETMISKHEAARVVDVGWAYVIEPSAEVRTVLNYATWYGQRFPTGLQYTSAVVDKLSVDELRELYHA